MERLALKVAYDGTKFHGSQRQPNVPTVEDALLSALARIGACQSADEGRFQMASRTDAGVSAAGNVAAVTTAFHPDKLADALNASLRFAWVLGAARVPADFHPRRAAPRT
ncbi:MAG TPA: tRNA pseudouridine(38-40) synthase TruA, partial [Candidatus Thermoplasmatota archaeon]|nr:tRNA pseudouridine(38-40) synthase TruA [Candidatus Thermoplasmatota archaeon]